MDKKKPIESPILDETMPHQINAPSFKHSSIKMQLPFINRFGVVIGDSKYNSEHSPLNQWSKETDPAIMTGKEWVHPTNDIGWNSPYNRALIEGKENQTENSVPFMHPTQNVDYAKD